MVPTRPALYARLLRRNGRGHARWKCAHVLLKIDDHVCHTLARSLAGYAPLSTCFLCSLEDDGRRRPLAGGSISKCPLAFGLITNWLLDTNDDDMAASVIRPNAIGVAKTTGRIAPLHMTHPKPIRNHPRVHHPLRVSTDATLKPCSPFTRCFYFWGLCAALFFTKIT